ncbi:hypothetical protein D0S45_19020 [Marinifilum sp. JC120]|nr:hypothetical protein D0S45_19020 [Marinifilum sp. JC120]
MNIYLKTCSLYEVKKAAGYGLIDGIVLLSEEGEQKCVATDNDSKSIVASVNGPVFVSATGKDSDELLSDVRELLRLSPSTVIKIKPTLEGFKVCKMLASKNVSVNMSGLDSITKAILAAKSGAEFISFDISKLKQKHGLEYDVLTETVKLMDRHGLHAHVLADISDETIDLDKVIGTGINGVEISFKVLMSFMGNDS